MDRVTESNSVLMDAWDVMNRDAQGFERLRGGLVEMSWSGHPVIFLNMAVTARRPGSLDEYAAAVREISAWAGERGLPWLLTVTPETLGDLMPGVERVMDEAGLAPMMALTGMEAWDLTPAARERPEGVWLTEADEGIGGKVLRVNEAGYQMVLAEPGTLEWEHPGWWGAPDRLATLLEVGGKPASCAAVLNTDGMRYVALVATHPEAQRNGYAEAVMRNVLERSLAAGLARRTYLHASDAGKPIYTRMGYRVTAEHMVYAKKEFLEAAH